MAPAGFVDLGWEARLEEVLSIETAPHFVTHRTARSPARSVSRGSSRRFHPRVSHRRECSRFIWAGILGVLLGGSGSSPRLDAAPPVQLTQGPLPSVRLDELCVASSRGTVEVPIWVKGARGADGLQVSIDYDEAYVGYAWYRTSNTNWRVERLAAYGHRRITIILRQNNKNLAPPDPLNEQEEIVLHTIFYLKEDAKEQAKGGGDMVPFRVQTPLSLGAKGPQGGVDTFLFTVDEASETYKPIRTRTTDGGLAIYFRDGVEVGSGELTRTEQAFRLPLYLTYLGGGDGECGAQGVFTVTIDYDEVFLGLVGIMGLHPPLEGEEEENPIEFEHIGKGQALFDLQLLRGGPPEACRLHVANLFFKYNGLPPKEDRLLIEPNLILDGDVAGLDAGNGDTDGGAAAHEPGNELGVLEFLPDLFVRGNVDSSQARDTRGVPSYLPDPTDVILILRTVFLGEGTLSCEDAADVNDNGRVDLSDAVSLLNHLFRGGPPPLSPYPDPGADAGLEDVLGCEKPVPYFVPR